MIHLKVSSCVKVHQLFLSLFTESTPRVLPLRPLNITLIISLSASSLPFRISQNPPQTVTEFILILVVVLAPRAFFLRPHVITSIFSVNLSALASPFDFAPNPAPTINVFIPSLGVFLARSLVKFVFTTL